MFAPPICRRSWWNNAFPFRQIRRRRRQRANIAASGASKQTEREQPQSQAASVGYRAPPHGGGASGGVLSSASDDELRRIHDVRAADLQEEDGGTTLFRPARSSEDGGNSANIAASGASKLDRARCASSLKERGKSHRTRARGSALQRPRRTPAGSARRRPRIPPAIDGTPQGCAIR